MDEIAAIVPLQHQGDRMKLRAKSYQLRHMGYLLYLVCGVGQRAFAHLLLGVNKDSDLLRNTRVFASEWNVGSDKVATRRARRSAREAR